MAREQYAQAVRFQRGDEQEKVLVMVEAVREALVLIIDGSTFYYVGAATLSAAATLAF